MGHKGEAFFAYRHRCEVFDQPGHIRVKMAERKSLPITAIARGRCSLDPAPIPTKGSRPRMAQSVVIRRGRRRTDPASTSASSRDLPASCKVFVYCRRIMAFLTTNPTSKIIPMNDESPQPQGLASARTVAYRVWFSALRRWTPPSVQSPVLLNAAI